jgi:hypothetical protein
MVRCPVGVRTESGDWCWDDRRTWIEVGFFRIELTLPGPRVHFRDYPRPWRELRGWVYRGEGK